MKKKLFSIILLLCLLTSISATAIADAAFPYVTDVAGLISQNEKAVLESYANEISAKYGCGVYIIVVDDFTSYSNSFDCFSAAEDIYLQYGLGLGSERNGLLLLLSMKERDFALAAYGNFANFAFTDYGKEVIIDSFVPALSVNNWYGGLNAYLESAESLLKCASDGNPVDVPELELSFSEALIYAFIIAAIIALIVCLVFKAQMKTAKVQAFASEYINKSSFNLYAQQDVFLHRSVTRQIIENSSSSSGGGGTTVNSSGFSGRSGKF